MTTHTPLSPPHSAKCWQSRQGSGVWPATLTALYRPPAQRNCYIYAITCADCGGHRFFRVKPGEPPVPMPVPPGSKILAIPYDVDLIP